MKDLDILNLPLNGIRLIEASAGTGKTYNLIIIYLRLLLNLGNPSPFLNPLKINEILVVTFTQSAVQNLRIRIKKNIRQFRLDCIRGYSHNQLFSKLLLQVHNINSAIALLLKAEQEIGQASIFTIHGFCRKILKENIIESGMLFNTSIIKNENLLYQQICFDFWRRRFYILPLNIVSFIQEHWNTPKELLKDISPYIYGETPKYQYFQFIEESNKDICVFYNQIINCINLIKNQWTEKQHDIFNTINTHALNRRTYNKKNLTSWIHTINQWTKQVTLDHTVPHHLKRFRLSILKLDDSPKDSKIFSILCLIEELYQRLSSFKIFICNIAIDDIRQNLDITKHLRSKITFNDLINILLHNGLKNKNNKLIQKILLYYPVAIIDEFQDTDPNQYKIFNMIYSHYPKKSLILIGDPKQSIYSFRGADIFTYIKTRRTLPNKYCLSVNWRSSPGMVNAVNQLFKVSYPFIFPDISFIPSLSVDQNNMHRFVMHNKPQSSMCFWLHRNHDIITIHDYKAAMAKTFAIVIQDLINSIYNQTTWIENNTCKKKELQISDITILVKDYKEASMIRSELAKINISTEFLSNKKNIFDTIESYELLVLLKAILSPHRKSICTALATIFFNLNVVKIENIYCDESQWEQVIEEFSEYYYIWKKYGIFSMIQKIIFRYNIPEKLLSMKSGKNNLMNIMYLGELLNNVSKRFTTEYELLQWLELKVMQVQDQTISPDYTTQLIHDPGLLKISTIHKSKGLEFPITFLPFIADFSYNKKSFFYKQKWYTNCNNSKNDLELLRKFCLSEDLRLLYVAVTRSIYHCAIGIAPIISRYHIKRSSNITDLHQTAIGYLIQNKKPGSLKLLEQSLHMLNIDSNGDINFHVTSENIQYFHNFTQQSITPKRNVCSRIWIPSKNICDDNLWSVTSYSDLKSHNVTKLINLNYQKFLNIDFNHNDTIKHDDFNITEFSPHTFPQGKVCGDFFHKLFQNLDFKKLINKTWLKTQMIRYNIDYNWQETIEQWIYIIINTPIDHNTLTLSKINPEYKQSELKFLLTINTNLDSQELDYLCKHYDALSLKSTELVFPKITGMLQGFIDLVFYWNQKYYLLDYKTNWLGENNDAYSISQIENSIIKNRYELQYQLYTLALHRFLKHRITSYCYEKDFGGVYYLFVRGMDGTLFSNGIYFCRPLWKFIKKLDDLFSKNTITK